VDFLKSRFDVQVFFEPGSALVRTAGYIVSTVLDVFQSGGLTVAVLDTTVNHMPEVFEYGYQPDIVGCDDDAAYEYLLAGCTCLAGDLFGVYRFGQRLRVGDKVVFNNAGSYTLTKAHVFNGVALPSVYALTTQGELVLKSRFTFAQYAAQWGIAPHASF
jgi:carboxynorspermidine decarboxylase